MEMFKRFIERRAEEALSDTPVVLIVGPRRADKTTLVKKMGEADHTYITLDDQTVLEAAQSDPVGFIRGLERDDGIIVGIEVKASATVKPGDFSGLRALAEACGDRFAFGVVLV